MSYYILGLRVVAVLTSLVVLCGWGVVLFMEPTLTLVLTLISTTLSLAVLWLFINLLVGMNEVSRGLGKAND